MAWDGPMYTPDWRANGRPVSDDHEVLRCLREPGAYLTLFLSGRGQKRSCWTYLPHSQIEPTVFDDLLAKGYIRQRGQRGGDHHLLHEDYVVTWKGMRVKLRPPRERERRQVMVFKQV